MSKPYLEMVLNQNNLKTETYQRYQENQNLLIFLANYIKVTYDSKLQESVHKYLDTCFDKHKHVIVHDDDFVEDHDSSCKFCGQPTNDVFYCNEDCTNHDSEACGAGICSIYCSNQGFELCSAKCYPFLAMIAEEILNGF